MKETDRAAGYSVSLALCYVLFDWHMIVCGKDASGSSSDDGGFAAGEGEGAGAGDSGHTLPVRNSRSVQFTPHNAYTRGAIVRSAVTIFCSLTFDSVAPRSTIYDLHTNGLLWCFVGCVDCAFVTSVRPILRFLGVIQLALFITRRD